MNRTIRLVLLVVVATAAGALAGVWLGRDAAVQQPVLERATLYPAPLPLPDFSLTDQHGQPFDRHRLTERWTLMFFGYTHCPDVCPTTLAALATARRELADLPPAQQPQVVFVSVDPERDTVAKLAGYTAFFDPAFHGVTGTVGDVQRLIESLGVVAVRGREDAYGNYTVDHTASVFLVGPGGAIVASYHGPHAPDAITHDYRVILDARPGSGA